MEVQIKSICCCFPTGRSSAANHVDQNPPDLIKTRQESTDLYCSHSIPNHEVMLWYKQSDSNHLQFLGYLNLNFPYPEDSLKSKIDLDGDGRNKGKLTVKNLQPNDSAVYFCAVRRHGVSNLLVPVQNHLSQDLKTDAPKWCIHLQQVFSVG